MSKQVERKIEPEEVTLQCSQCHGDIDVQQDVDNEGMCDPCTNAQNEMWAAELKHEAYEYRDMKI
jgi:hypothetical protein